MMPADGLVMVMALLGAAGATWGYLIAGDGLLAFARPIRGRMGCRRRVQMATYLLVFAILGSQSVLTPQVAFLLIGVLLLALAIHQATGWVAFQEILAASPLEPDARDAASAGRILGHMATNELSIVIGALDLLQREPGLTDQQHQTLGHTIAAAEAAAARIREQHQQIRALDPTWRPTP